MTNQAPVIEDVSIEDVYPYEDEWGNQILARAYDDKVNEAYIADLAESIRKSGGTPINLPVLARDGGIFRILDGNSRIRAMRVLGTKRFPAQIQGEVGDGAVKAFVEAALLTDTKKKYETLEKSRLVQQLAMFGDDQYVAEIADMTVEQAARVRRAAAVVDDAAEDMSLFKLAAIGEFDGDEDAVAELAACPERELAATLGRLRSRRQRAKQEMGMAGTLGAAGIPIVDAVSGMRQLGILQRPEDLPADLPDGCMATRHNIPGFFVLWAPADPAEERVDDRAEAQAANREAAAKLYRPGAERRMRFAAAAITGGGPGGSKAMADFAAARDRKLVNATVQRFLMQTETELDAVPLGPIEVIAAIAEANDSDWGICGYDGEPKPKLCRTYVELLDAMEADGYEPDADEADIYKQASAVLAGREQQ